MKYAKKWKRYSTKLIRNIKSYDRSLLEGIKERLDDVSEYAIVQITELINKSTIGGTDLVDYTRADRLLRKYLSKIDTNAYQNYNSISKRVAKSQKVVYFNYRKDIMKIVKEVDLKPKEEKIEEQVNATFGGTPSQSFTKHLRSQLRTGFEPASLIKTVSREHVALIQRQLMVGISKGKGYRWATDKVIKEMLPVGVDKAIKRKMEYNVTRIMRTSYMRAVNLDTADFVAKNGKIFYGSRRTADGNPCLMCIMLDGKFYKPGGILEDHPNGQCLLVPLMYPQEFLLTGAITALPNDTWGMSMAQQFYMMDEIKQIQAFGNKKLYNLWKKERFDIEKIISVENGLLRGLSADKAAAESFLTRAGGVSYPSADVPKALNVLIDPKDRLNKNLVIRKQKPVGGKNSYGIDMVGDGSDYIGAGVSNEIKAKIHINYEAGISGRNWVAFNERARELGIYTRMDSVGQLYYVVPKSKVVKQWLKLKEPVKKVEIGSSKEITQSFKNKKVKSVSDDIEQGVNSTEVVVLDDNSKWIRKKAGEAVNNEMAMEEVYYQFSKDLGMNIVPKTGLLSDKVVVQEFVKSGKTWGDMLDEFYLKYNLTLRETKKLLEKFIINAKEGSDWVLLDFLFKASDRHIGNFMIKYEKGKIEKLWLIDNGRAFGDVIVWNSPWTKIVANKSIALHKSTVVGLKKFLKLMKYGEVTKKVFRENIKKYFKRFKLKNSTVYGRRGEVDIFISKLEFLIDKKFVLNRGVLSKYDLSKGKVLLR